MNMPLALTKEQIHHLNEYPMLVYRMSEHAGVIGIAPMVFTYALCVHINPNPPEGHYEYRYCYESYCDVLYAFNNWDGKGHPPGNWIKRKGKDGDLINPNLEDLDHAKSQIC